MTLLTKINYNEYRYNRIYNRIYNRKRLWNHHNCLKYINWSI